MKKQLLFLMGMSIGLLSVAQKVDLDRFVFKATYRGLPAKPLDASYNTYSFNIASTESVRNNFTDDQVKTVIALEGWKKVDGTGHLLFTVNMQDVAIENADVKTRDEEIKDKEGKVTGKKTYYFVQAIYSWAGTFKVADYKGADLNNWSLADRTNKMSWNSDEFGTHAEAAAYYNNNKYQVRSTLTTQLVTNALNGISRQLNSDYGFRMIQDQDFVWILDSKKHAEYEAQKQSWEVIKEAMKLMNESDSLSVVRQKLQPAFAYLESLKTKITSTEKNDKKLLYGAYYTLAKLHLLLDEPDATIKEAEGLIANDYDPKDGKRLIEEAESLKKLFERNKIYTRHFPINTSGYKSPVTP